MRRTTGREMAPQFPDDLQWFNVEQPLTMKQLRGKVILVNFWTSACINSAHVIPDFRRLLAKHAPELAVIGVHSPRFAAERDPDVLCNALARLDVDYPVINDRDMRLWREWDIRAWPTTILISPTGAILQRRTGEDVFGAFDERVGTLIRDFKRSGGINDTPVPTIAPEPRCSRPGLSFPTGIEADEATQRIFISDTGNNRVVVADFDGNVQDVVGSGKPGLQDGPYDAAAFHGPKAVLLDGEVLYVADRRNHCIRRIDLDDRQVLTIAGTGEQELAMMLPGKAPDTPLNSPWGLTIVHHRLYMTMAGTHQIWRMDLMTDEIEPFAGTGTVGLENGRRGKCLLAQPVGLTNDGVRLFFVDAGSSALRWIHLPPGVHAGTWVGQGVFEYGDRDGSGREALMESPLGLTHHLGEIYIADTYNHKIKHFNPRAARIETILGTGAAGFDDGPDGTLNEPADVAWADGELWIADRSNHAVRIGSADGGPLRTLELRSLPAVTAPTTVCHPYAASQ